ncbi:MAG: hypothetical protein GY756_17565 [bacterium]|nr:hypothetical protein [bacterium]
MGKNVEDDPIHNYLIFPYDDKELILASKGTNKGAYYCINSVYKNEEMTKKVTNKALL